jgi:type I restriction enzyme, S subunit
VTHSHCCEGVLVGDLVGTTRARGFASGALSWPLVRAGDLFELRYGKALVESSRRPGGVPVYGTNGQCGWHDSALFKGPGVILGRKGQGPLGVEWTDVDFWVIDTAYSLAVRRADLDLRFAYYLIKYIGLNHLKDGTSNPSLSRDTFGAQALPLPPLREQVRIATVLTALDDKIELNRRMNETLEEMARALFKSWFVDFDPVCAKLGDRTPSYMDTHDAAMFPSGLDSSADIRVPQGWRRTPLGEVLELKRGFDLPSAQRRPGRIQIISSSGLSGFHDTAQVQGPGVVTGRYGTIGKVFLVWDDYWPLNTALYVRDFKGMDPLFALYLLRELDFEKFSDKGAVPGINRNHVHLEPVTIPPPVIQQRFVDIVRPWLTLVRHNTAESATLADLRDLLLPKLLSGELRIRDAERAVEAVA